METGQISKMGGRKGKTRAVPELEPSTLQVSTQRHQLNYLTQGYWEASGDISGCLYCTPLAGTCMLLNIL